ncbi:hypothetical protein [Pseudonocardia lacus]|uniref:hypothetical protein n=1 Tax=Pseudonocardia lacus TaxID=2835865 RepID=UPI001BDC98F5|nr:hypothetical protein [Pseudonocardia lacus]
MILIGVVLLALLAGAIGLRSRDESVHRDRAWREIATERRRIWEERQRLEDLLESVDLCEECAHRHRASHNPFG